MDNEFIERVEDLFKNNGIAPTGTELEKIGLTRSSLYNWKTRSDPSVKAIISLSEYFGVSTDYLLFGKRDQLSKLSKKECDLIKSFKMLDEKDQAFIDELVYAYAKNKNNI